MTTAIPGSETVFNFASQRLNVSLPQVALQNSARGYIPPEQWDEGIPAALLNYSFTGNRGSEDDSYYLNLQSGLNYGAWRLRNNGAWRYTQTNGQRHSEWQNIGTWAQRTVIPLKSELVLGDSNTGNDVFDSMGSAADGSSRLTACTRTACRATRPRCVGSPGRPPKWWCVRMAT